jgi:hypothetical protein
LQDALHILADIQSNHAWSSLLTPGDYKELSELQAEIVTKTGNTLAIPLYLPCDTL